jgi:hypothetical protein
MRLFWCVFGWPERQSGPSSTEREEASAQISDNSLSLKASLEGLVVAACMTVVAMFIPYTVDTVAQRDIGYTYQGLLFPFYLSRSQLQIIDAAISTPEEVDLCHCHCCRLGRSLAYALFSCLVLQSVPMPESFSSITTVVHRDATPSYPSTLASEPLTAAISFC